MGCNTIIDLDIMADMENDSIPTYDVMAPVKSLKVVDKAFELPVVSSAYTEIATLACPITPYVESSVKFITPIVEGGCNTIKEKVMPHLPDGTAESLHSKVNGAVAQLTVAVEKVDTLACGGMDQLLEKVPALKEETPELIKNTKETASTCIHDTSSFVASFSVVLVMLKMLDAGLDVVETALKTVSSDEDSLGTYVKKIHGMANDLRLEGSKRAGTEKAQQIEAATLFGAFVEVSGLAYLMGVLGFGTTATKHVAVEKCS